MTSPPTALEHEVLARITPTPQEEAACQTVVRDLTAAADAELARLGMKGHATVQGSVAKGTWISGSGDIDLFLLLDPAVPADRLERVALDVGKRILADAHTRYAQHPYLIGTYRGRTVDLVPAYAVGAAGSKMSAVDRTPFHTAWVRTHLDAAGLASARLLKRFLTGAGCYGAQTATGGFSGYLAEVLVASQGSFHGALRWLAGDAQPRRLHIGADEVKDDVSPLVVVDPVDPARNCAAAVQTETLAQACDAARTYLGHPRIDHFFPAPPRAEAATALHTSLAEQGATWAGVLVRPRTDRLDIVFPQFQRAARSVAAGLEDAGFAVYRTSAAANAAGDEVLLQWIANGRELPATRTHAGPLEAVVPNAERFRAKWAGHPDAAGPVRRGAAGQLEVDVRVRERTAGQWITAHLRTGMTGRHVQDALPDARVMLDPADAPAPWAPAVADTVLRRRPWER
ncbi:MAG: CCA tRNA nucleotidyltransferase [bacterium]